MASLRRKPAIWVGRRSDADGAHAGTANSPASPASLAAAPLPQDLDEDLVVVGRDLIEGDGADVAVLEVGQQRRGGGGGLVHHEPGAVGGAVGGPHERLGGQLLHVLARQPAALGAHVDEVAAEGAAAQPVGRVEGNMRPADITATRSQSAASPTYCVDTMSVRPLSRSDRKCVQKRSRRIGSMPAVGSSSTISSGSCTRAAASASRRCMPPDASAQQLAAVVVEADEVERLVQPAAPVAAPHAVERGGEAQVVPERQVREQRHQLRQVADAGPLGGRGVDRPHAEDLDVARRRFTDPEEDADQRGLAAAARPDQAHDGAAGHGEVDPVEHDLVAEGAHEPVAPDDRRRRDHGSGSFPERRTGKPWLP